MKKEEVAREEVHIAREYSNYVLGILSIVLAILTAWGIGGIILGIIGLVRIGKKRSYLSKKAKLLNLIGLIIGVVIFIVSLIIFGNSINWGTEVPVLS